MEKNRINYFDIAKGIGMLCVILGHLSVSGINMIVFTFHMPLFFIISGYFLKKHDTKVLIHKKARQLLVPYLLTCMAIMILSALKDLLLGRTEEMFHNLLLWAYAGFYGSGNPYSQPFYVKPIGAIWFLLAMFWSVIIYNSIMNRKYCSVWVLVLALAGTEPTLTYYKSGTFATESLVWPDSVDAVKKANAFVGSAISHA